MQLRPVQPPTPPSDLAAGLAAGARDRGQRPAVTVLSAAGRAEQGYVTLAQWAAKGAHLLAMDLAAGTGTRVHVDVPPGWTLAAVCAAVWWVGGTEEVQAFPDAPPPSGARPDLVALDDGTPVTHAELVAALDGERGVLGVDLATFTGNGVREVAARPLVTGRATVVLRDVPRDAAAGDRVTTWA